MLPARANMLFPVVDSLATIAGFNANIVIAYQAKDDVRNLSIETLMQNPLLKVLTSIVS
jgi:hypothetical protein